MQATAEHSALGAWSSFVLDWASDVTGRGPETDVAGGPLRLRVCADPLVVDGAGALDPRALRPSEPGSAVPTLDVALLGARPGLPDAPPAPPRTRVHLQRGSLHALIEPEGRGWVLDSARRLGCRVQLEGAVEGWERVGPLRPLLTWWAAANGFALVHAAAVSTGGAAVLVAGPPSAGKSTVAMACRNAGWEVLGDDYCVVEPGPPPVVHPLYGYAKASAH